jgi:Tol biopolymer transport system component
MVTLGLLFVAASLGFLQSMRSPRDVPGNPPRQLTSNSSENHISGGVISPDGRYLAYTDKTGMHIKLIATGELQNVAQPEAVLGAEITWEVVRWFPDGTSFVANSHPSVQDPTEWSAEGSSIWVFSLLQGVPHKLRDNAEAFSVSPDGDWIAFGTRSVPVIVNWFGLKMGGTRPYPSRFGDREIWLMAGNGQQAHKLYEMDEDSAVHGMRWSADGKRTLYVKTGKAGTIIETNDLQGGLPKEALRVPQKTPLRDYLWLPDGRLIYVLDGEATNSDNCNYWELPINTRTGEALRQPRQVTNWTGFCMGSTSVTLDGKHVAYLKWKANTSVYVADFKDSGTHITVPRRLTLDENYNNPMAWTPDSRSVFFLSDRNGPWGIFKQAIDGEMVEAVVTAREVSGGARITPDGSWMLYQAKNWDKKQGAIPLDPVKVMRIPIAGGVPELVLTGALSGLGCASSHGNLCAFAERGADSRQLIFTALDPLKGRGRELARLEISPNDSYTWNLSPDGTRIAVLQHRDSGITIIHLSGGHRQRVLVRGWDPNSQQRLAGVMWWTADGKGLIAGSLFNRGSVLLHIDLKGNATVLWQRESSPGTFGVPSPDGRRLAMSAWDMSSNLWMIDNF